MGAEQSGVRTPEKELAPRSNKSRRGSSKAQATQNTVEVSTPEKKSGEKRRGRRGKAAVEKAPVEAPKAKRQRSGKSKAAAGAVTEEATSPSITSAAHLPVHEPPQAAFVQPELLRLDEPGAGHVFIQLTGHLPGTERIPEWMQAYSSENQSMHEDQPVYASQDGNYLLYHSSGPGVGQGWWLGRAADGTSSAAALAFLPRGHTEWWFLDEGCPQLAEVLVTTVTNGSATSVGLSASSLHEESDHSLTGRAAAGLMRVAEPGAEHPVVQLTGHLPGEGRIPAWMQVYSSIGCPEHQGQCTYSSQDGKYLLYHSSGPGVGQGWWLGNAADGTSSSAAFAFLPCGHDHWWVLDGGEPQQVRVVMIANLPADAAVQDADDHTFKEDNPAEDLADMLIHSEQHHEATSSTLRPSRGTRRSAHLETELPDERFPATPFAKAQPLRHMPASMSASATTVDPAVSAREHFETESKAHAASSSRSPAASRKSSSSPGSTEPVHSRKSSSSSGRADSITDCINRIAQPTSRSTGASRVDAGRGVSIERIARSPPRADGSDRAVSLSGPSDRPHRDVSDPHSGTSGRRQDYPEEQTVEPGMFCEECSLVIMAAEDCFLDDKSLRQQEQLLKSFEKMSLKLQSGVKGTFKPVKLVAVPQKSVESMGMYSRCGSATA